MKNKSIKQNLASGFETIKKTIKGENSPAIRHLNNLIEIEQEKNRKREQRNKE